MIIDSLRILATSLLFIAMMIYKIPLQNMYKNSLIQIYIAIFCLIILMFVDNITGFIITLTVLIIYFRVYSIEIKEKKKEFYENDNTKKDNKNISNKKCIDNKCSLDYPEMKNNDSIKNESINSIKINTCGLQPYITPEHLMAVQTNILDNNTYNDEISDVNVLPDEYKNLNVYKSQGLNTGNYHLNGYDNYNIEYGTLDFKNLFDN